ncbi:MAG: alpha/beta fold hydrolase [Phycisphaerae bacterium]
MSRSAPPLVRVRRAPAIYLALLGASCAVQFVWPRPAPPAAGEHAVHAPRQTANGCPTGGDAVRIVYRDTGPRDADVVVLLHGSPGVAANFAHLEPLLAPRYRVLAPDLPGFGKSTRAIPDYGIHAQAHYVLAWLDALGVERAHLLGFSMGSAVALHVAELAPQRVRSLVFYGGLGVQEGEGSGDYYFEHFKYALGWGLLVAGPELVPHFGLLGARSARHAFIRSFWDTDQRPLRALLGRLRAPLLVLHGRDDPLVPVWAAREHHRIVPESELVVFDAGHFMLFNAADTRRLADEILPFIERAAASPPVVARRTMDPFASERPAPLLPGQVRIARGVNAWLLMALIGGATFVSEDLTCIATGLLIRAQHLDLFVGIIGCFVGIFVGDLGLWLLGRVCGRRVLAWRIVQRRLPAARFERLGAWLDQHAFKAVITARFVPGTRFAVYVGAGIVGRRAGRFVLAALVASLLWTPLLVALVVLLGERVVAPLERVLGSGWLALLAALGVLFLIVRGGEYLLTPLGRAKLGARVARLWRWEFWPAWLFYLPLVPWIAWLALRHRGLTTPTAANPAIPHGGVVGESKFDILRQLPPEFVVPTERLDPAPAGERTARLERVIQERGWALPLILKPDASQRGAGLKLLRDLADAPAYFAAHPDPVIAQVYHPGPFEAGVFYVRVPGEARGRIFSITDKRFPVLRGDGRRTVEQLIWAHPRYRMQAAVFLARLDGQAARVLSNGEALTLAVAGNHCQGTLFCDGAHLATAALEATIDRTARAFDGFFFGRFDVRYSDVQAFKDGRDFAIVELNGVTSESTNIYDPSWPLWRAYLTLYRQWAILFAIGARNRAAGHAVTPLRTIWRATRAYYRQRRVRLLAD